MLTLTSSRSHQRARRMALIGAVLISAAIVGSQAAAPSAHAVDYDTIAPGNRYGTLDIVLNEGATIDDLHPIKSVTSTEACPAANRFQGSEIVSFDNNVYLWSPSWLSTGADAAGRGLDGNPINVTDSSRIGGAFPLKNYKTRTATGEFEYIIVCSDRVDSLRPQNEGVKFFAATLKMEADGTLSVVGDGGPVDPPEKVTPTVAIGSGTANADGSVTLTATVSGTDGAVTDAKGKVVFTSGDVTGEALVGTDGTATWKSGVLTAGQSYSFTARYVPDANDTIYNGSAESAAQPVTVVAEPQPPVNTEITVVIPSAATGLKLTVVDGGVALGAPVTEGASWLATGQLPEVTVTDNRETKTKWTVTGEASDFASNPAGSTIGANYLGWAPGIVGTGAGTAGPAVEAGVGDGLGAASPLATAPDGATGTQTTVGAGLTLKAPADSAAGSYASTLTLTLI